MRRKYSIATFGFLLAAAATAGPCPAALTEIAGRVAELRHVPGPFNPPCRLIKPAELRNELDRKLRRDLPVAPELYLQALMRTGFIDGDPSTIYNNLLAFYSGQVLGFYEPQADEMVVVDTPAAERIEGAFVWAHELAHAAQEHRFHLPSRLVAIKGDSDEQRAASAVAEGEAMLVMFLLDSATAGDEQLSAAESAVGHQAMALSAPPGLPRYFVDDLIFPYSAGFSAALRAYRKGGWPEVDRLLAHPPASSAALLHPERSAPPATFLPRELPPPPDGWEEVLTDDAGEWGLAFLLGRRMKSAEADAAATAWDGDLMRLIRNRAHPDTWALAWRIRCRSAEARQALEETMQRVLPGLLARLAPPSELQLTWVAAGRTLELRAGWPPPRPSPS
jgi:hypothetical protein